MEWWFWVIIALVAFAIFTWWISRLPGERGNEEDFKAVTETYLSKASEYYKMAERSMSPSSLPQIQQKLDVLAGDYIDMAKRFDLAHSQTALDANKAISRLRHAVSTAAERNDGPMVVARQEKEEALHEMYRLQKHVSALYDEAIDEMADGHGDISVLKRNMAKVLELEKAAQVIADSPGLISDDLLYEFAYIQESRSDMQRFVESSEYQV